MFFTKTSELIASLQSWRALRNSAWELVSVLSGFSVTILCMAEAVLNCGSCAASDSIVHYTLTLVCLVYFSAFGTWDSTFFKNLSNLRVEW